MKKVSVFVLFLVLFSVSVLAQQFHPAEQVKPGTFGIGNYTFNDSLIVIRAGTTSLTQPSGEWAMQVEQSTDAIGKYGLSVATRWAAVENKIFEVARHWDGSENYYPIFYVDGEGDIYWKDGSTTQNTLMFWDRSTSSVGIGTTNPGSAKLNVSGAANYGIYAETSTTTLNEAAIYGKTTSTGFDNVVGVKGDATSSSGANAKGVYGIGNIGVYGQGTYGVTGYSDVAGGYSGYFFGGKGMFSDKNISVGNDGDYVYHKSNCVHVNATNTNGVNCPAGTTLVSGGENCNNYGSTSTKWSYPLNSTTWVAACNGGNADVFAICCG